MLIKKNDLKNKEYFIIRMKVNEQIMLSVVYYLKMKFLFFIFSFLPATRLIGIIN